MTKYLLNVSPTLEGSFIRTPKANSEDTVTQPVNQARGKTFTGLFNISKNKTDSFDEIQHKNVSPNRNYKKSVCKLRIEKKVSYQQTKLLHLFLHRIS